MTQISQELVFIQNLKNAALFHTEFCAKEQCGVTLFLLKETARYICIKMKDRVPYPLDEIREANKLISEMPIV